MFFSLAVIMISGLAAGAICKKMKLPPLLGMLLAGILTGPFVLNLIDGSILGISAELRKMAHPCAGRAFASLKGFKKSRSACNSYVLYPGLL